MYSLRANEHPYIVRVIKIDWAYRTKGENSHDTAYRIFYQRLMSNRLRRMLRIKIEDWTGGEGPGS